EPVLETVSGSVMDGTATHPIAHATVTFVNASEKESTESANDGTFSVTLPAGTYHLVVSAKGYEAAQRDAIIVGDQAVNVQITLYTSGDLKTIASVTVGAPASAINVTPASVSQLTSSQIIAQGSVGIARVLAEIPGVQVGVASAGAGSTRNTLAQEYAVNSPADPVTIGIRGSQAYENAVLFDGHRISSNNWFGAEGGGTGSSATQGVFNFANLDAHSISSLDVVKGPGADSPTINNAVGGMA